jgi:membrane protein YqaA with SNARE-associated domain
MLRRLYDWCIAAADKPHATWLMGAFSFVESSFFPVPPDAMLIPMAIARPDKAWFYATSAPSPRSPAGVLGYLIGACSTTRSGSGWSNSTATAIRSKAFREAYAQWGGWIILLKGLTPIPYKIVTIASGFAGYNLLLFILLSIIARDCAFTCGVSAQPLRRPGAHDHRGATGVLGHRGCGGPGRRHYRRPVSSLKVPSLLIFATPPCAGSGWLRRRRERDDQPSGNNSHARFGDRGARGGRHLRAAPGFLRARAGGSVPKSGSRAGVESCRKSERSGPFSPVAAVAATAEPVETFGRWLDQGTTKFRTDMQGAQQTFDKLGTQTRDAAKDVTDAMIGLPNARVVTARERCAAAKNGSPDCQAAVDTFCRGKGFQPGRASIPSRS